ncbi:SOS response-associated peptidase [Adhaeribacter pallidiroseus]|uniref:Abasic site processing protein n=1 Tax=Adhaeribacter pallidiroseus TaxID=2072847 RepID=A0A369QJY6_9BACT|nr:SOS response-associated peptidase [Adhaeribacter pallidiroseus]RDC64630.1 putative SOS response-associated peptidase YoaM [Adhaeribacter pallidiroseus]
MCGRYSETEDLEAIEERFDVRIEEPYQPSYDARPGDVLPVITNTDPKHLTFMKWSILPHWAPTRDFKYDTFNAKSEELTWKPSFRSLITTKRCLVPASGFYEWKDVTPVEKDMFGQVITKPKTKKQKEIYFINLKDENLLAFAGLWDEWVDTSSGEVVRSFTIITTRANELVKPIHPERMPVILDRDIEKLWLSNDLSKQELLDLLQPFDAAKMQARPIPSIAAFPNPQ